MSGEVDAVKQGFYCDRCRVSFLNDPEFILRTVEDEAEDRYECDLQFCQNCEADVNRMIDKLISGEIIPEVELKKK